MDKKIQSRRDFFKKAAKGALPILGIITFMQVPLNSRALQVIDCNNSCSGSCSRTCKTMCGSSSPCTSVCRGNCSGNCSGSCSSGSK